MNVQLWAVSSGYLEGQLVGTGECGGLGCIEWLLGFADSAYALI